MNPPLAPSHVVLTSFRFSAKLLLSSGMRFQCSTSMPSKQLIVLFRIFWTVNLHSVVSQSFLVATSDKLSLSSRTAFDNSLFLHPSVEVRSGLMYKCSIYIKTCVWNSLQRCRNLLHGY